MNMIPNETINSTRMKVRSAKTRLVGFKKANAIIGACICIYSTSSSAVFTENVGLISMGMLSEADGITLVDGQTFNVTPEDPTINGTFEAVGRVGNLEWRNDTGKDVTVDVKGTFFEDGTAFSTVTLASITLTSINSPTVQLRPGFEITPVSVSRTFGEGDYTIKLTSPDSLAKPEISFKVQMIPEPETYAMMLAGLGVLGWRLRRSRN